MWEMFQAKHANWILGFNGKTLVTLFLYYIYP